MNEVMYLRNGEAVEVKEQLSNGQYLVEMYHEYEGDDENIYCELSGEEKIADKVYPNPPIQKIADEVKRINKAIADKQVAFNLLYLKKHDIQREIEGLEKNLKETKANISKNILNYNTAKSKKESKPFVHKEDNIIEELALNLPTFLNYDRDDAIFNGVCNLKGSNDNSEYLGYSGTLELRKTPDGWKAEYGFFHSIEGKTIKEALEKLTVITKEKIPEFFNNK